MKKLTTADPETKTADIADNIDWLKAIFPESFAVGKIA